MTQNIYSNLFCLGLALSNVVTSTAFVPCDHQKHATKLHLTSTDQVRSYRERSASLPFLPRPQNCKGYVGDVGFDPFSFSDRSFGMEFLREAELKHGRICMLAWTGWVAVDL